MKTPYLTIPFSLSKESLQWLKEKTDPMVDNYQKTAPLDAALIEFPRDTMQEWYDSQMWKEIQAQLTPMGLNEEPLIQFFIYKKLAQPKGDPRGNPHIDTFKGVDGIVPIRFNILVSGAEDEEMVWWDIHDWDNDNRLHVMEFPRPTDPTKFSKRVQARGNSMSERWATIGEPEYRWSKLTKLNTWASFVRTDRLHAINWSGHVPRLIMSLRFLAKWDELEALVS